MKVVLIESPYRFWPRYLGVKSPCLGILFLGSYLKSVGHDVRVIDAPTLHYTWGDVREALRREEPDVVGITAYASNVYKAMTVAHIAKEVCPDAIVIGGGQHFTAVPHESLTVCPEIDYIVMGEGELTAAELLAKLEAKAPKEELRNVQGLAFMDGDEFVATEPRPLIEDLDDLPMPDWELLPVRDYDQPFLVDGGRKGCITTLSRGCAHHCSFCAEQVLWRNTWRARSPRLAVDELEMLHRKYGHSGVQLGDDAFSSDREWNEQFIAEMHRRNMYMPFWVQVRADHIVRDRDLWKAFRSIGATMVMIGMEAPRQSFLNEINKSESIDTIKEAAKIVHDAGVPVIQGTFTVGVPDDTPETIKGLGRYSAEVGVDMFSPNMYTPFPGTPLWRQSLRNQMIEDWDYSHWDFDHAVARTRTMSAAEVERADLNIFAAYTFLRPAFWLEQLQDPDKRRMHLFGAKNLWYLLTRERRVPKQEPRHYEEWIDVYRKRHLAYVVDNYYDGQDFTHQERGPRPKLIKRVFNSLRQKGT